MNVFQNNIVTAIKVGGKVLRENGDTVTLPFGSEYSILVKNLNSVRTQINVSVDGQDAAGKLVIGPNSSMELERFIRNGNLESGNRFKFIERSAEIEAHRGVQVDDGLIRVEAWRERVTMRVPVPRPEYYDDPYPVPVPRPYPVYPAPYPWRPRPFMQGPMRPMSATGRPMHPTSKGAPRPDTQASMGRLASRAPERERGSINTTHAALGDIGITAPGSESRQRFVSVSKFPLESQSVVIVLRLRGVVDGQTVEEPLTVDRKPECSMCGKSNPATSQFCGQCGTALVLI
jgi:hypothetical protein